MKTRLDAAAAESGRSQSQEAEFRLERSFGRQELIYEAVEMTFGRRLGALLLVLGNSIARTTLIAMLFEDSDRSRLARQEQDDLLLDPTTYAEVIKAVGEIMTRFRPTGAVDPDNKATALAQKYQWESIGKTAAEAVIATLQDKAAPPLSWVGRLRPALAGLGVELPENESAS